MNAFPDEPLNWSTILDEVKRHRSRLLKGNLIALLAVVCSVPVPLFLPVLVDEVLLHKPGGFIAFFSPWFPKAWHGADPVRADRLTA
jgi:ATP-binding cassette subfamily C protein